MAARAESQAGDPDNGAAPLIPSAFKSAPTLSATEAIMWIACRRRFSLDTILEHLRRHRDRGKWRYGRSQLRRPLLRRAEEAERQLIGLIIGGVPAIGTLDDEGHHDHQKRVRVPVEFLKDGAFIDLLSGHIRADPLLVKHQLQERPKYRDVSIYCDVFFAALEGVPDSGAARSKGGHEKTKRRKTRKRNAATDADIESRILGVLSAVDSRWPEPLKRPQTAYHAARLLVAGKPGERLHEYSRVTIQKILDGTYEPMRGLGLSGRY